MPGISFRLAGTAAMIAAVAISSPAIAQHSHSRSRHETRAERRAFRSHRNVDRGGGRGDGIYPPAYDAARNYYGGRGDTRWRWTEPGGRAGAYYGAPFLSPFGFYYGY